MINAGDGAAAVSLSNNREVEIVQYSVDKTSDASAAPLSSRCRRQLGTFALAALVLAFTTSGALSEDKEAAKKACMNDYKKYCAGVFPGGGRVKKCMSENLGKLEPACREIVSRNLNGESTAKPR